MSYRDNGGDDRGRDRYDDRDRRDGSRRIPLYRNEFRIQFGRDPNKRFHLYDVAIKVRMWSSEHKLCTFY